MGMLKPAGFHWRQCDSQADCWICNPAAGGEAGLAALLEWPHSVAGVLSGQGECGGSFAAGNLPESHYSPISNYPLCTKGTVAEAVVQLSAPLPFLCYENKIWAHIDRCKDDESDQSTLLSMP